MFKKKSDSVLSEKNFNLIEMKHAEAVNLQKKLDNFNKTKFEIESKFTFNIPNYIIDEIRNIQDNNISNNLSILINCAVLNGQLSIEEGNILKQTYLN